MPVRTSQNAVETKFTQEGHSLGPFDPWIAVP
jgi:hypothetical protein